MTDNRSATMERLAEDAKPFLWTQALFITRKVEDAEDLLQETLMNACKGFEGFDLDTNFRAWAARIMINTNINKIRRRAVNTLPLDDVNLNCCWNDSPHVSDTDDPERVFFHNYISDGVMALFQTLPKKHRIAFALFHFNGYTYEEISSAIDIPVGTVKSRIFRARQTLSETAIGMSIPQAARQTETITNRIA